MFPFFFFDTQKSGKAMTPGPPSVAGPAHTSTILPTTHYYNVFLCFHYWNVFQQKKALKYLNSFHNAFDRTLIDKTKIVLSFCFYVDIQLLDTKSNSFRAIDDPYVINDNLELEKKYNDTYPS